MENRRSIWANATLALLAPALFLLILEIALAAAGVWPLALTEDPLVGFSSLQPLFVEDPAADGVMMKTNPAKLTHFNPQSFPRKKPEGAYRIFTVGGSTTYGHPWRDPVSYSGWLRELLSAADPGRPWEVINAGGISYASYREAKLVEEITRYHPDLIIVYSGHNEFLEERTYRKTTEIPAVLREASALLDRTRTFTVMRNALRKARSGGHSGGQESGAPGDGKDKPRLSAEVDDVLARTIGPKTYTRDDALRSHVLEHYRLSLERIAALAHSVGAQVLFLTTPGNERDCSPFKSEPTPGLPEADRIRAVQAVKGADSLLAAGRPTEALSILEPLLASDPRDADLLYRAGKAALAAGRHGDAKRLLDKALEEDVCPLRALPAMRDIVLETAGKTASEALDVTALLEAKTRTRLGHDILGEPEFVDHVHLSIDEYRGLALGIIDKLIALGVVHPRHDWGETVVRQVIEKVMAGMGPRELGEGLHNIAKVLNWAGKHEDAARIAAQGLAVDSNGLEAIWSSLFVGAALERQGRSADALPHYRRAIRLDPSNEMSRQYLFDALQRAGFPPEEASRQTAAAAPLPGASDTQGSTDPGQGSVSGSGTQGTDPIARASMMLQEGKVGEAMAFLQGVHAETSDRAGLVLLLGEAQRRSGDAASAAGSYRRALQLNPKEARAHLGLARLAESRGDTPEAIAQYAKALSIAPNLDEARADLSRALQGMSAAPGPPMRVLGISAFYHDSAACLIGNGPGGGEVRVLAAAEEERFSRKKHDSSFPEAAIAWCLEEAGLSGRDLDAVAFYEKPLVKFERILESQLAFAPSGFRTFAMAMPRWIRSNLWIKDTIARRLDFKGPILFPEHHLSHGAAAFFPSPHPEAAVLTMDGVGEWATTSFGEGRGNRLSLHSEIRFPHSLGLLYTAFTYYLGFKVNSGEYKVMGLAPYGRPAYKDLILGHLIDLKEDGSYRLNMDYFGYGAGLAMTNHRFHALFGGPPRSPGSAPDQKAMDIARSIQEVLEEAVLRMGRHVHKATGHRHLCLGGGVALNCVANGRLLREGPFESLWIQPAAGDAGGAMGAAWAAWHHYLDQPRQADGRKDLQRGSFLGPAFDAASIKSFLDGRSIPYKELSPGEVASTAASLIDAQKVIGWFQGRMEFGPRALGARSILADARNPRMRDILNEKVKYRESFRPFAASVLRERVSACFELDADSPYMLLVAPVRKVLRAVLPSVTHSDGSARIQTVDGAAPAAFRDLLREMDARYGCPVIINTSFNVRGEPMVRSPEEAFACFRRAGLDHLFLETFLLSKEDFPSLPADEAGPLELD